jgi:hypothetical protein
MDRIIVQRPEKTSTAEMMRNSYWKKNQAPGFSPDLKKFP